MNDENTVLVNIYSCNIITFNQKIAINGTNHALNDIFKDALL